MLKTITDCWGGFLFKFPELSQWNGEVYMYKVDSEISAVICMAKVNEAFNDNLDFMLPEKSLDELYLTDNMLLTPVIIAVEYNDRMVVARVSSFLADKARYYHDGKAFLPKEHFNLLRKR
jgi:hypothetical protein